MKWPWRRIVYRLKFHWQGWRIRRRGDFDLGVSDPYGRMYLTPREVESLGRKLAAWKAEKELKERKE